MVSDGLTVQELIDELEDLDQDCPVHIHASGAFKDLRRVSQEDITWNTGEEETVVSLR